ncbi:hypothetical protein GXP67_27295 [Rhodocytophaga rosea]|uniref:Uncharacterized protein n=1 Tax=Rhodocytophaga rosea TaxID=2704465 RepID=A0A6C0GPU4_9BACT|nr:hypothetical protein [Rhodocytophaga rosea]QHT70088.1 hypothetical protein GXP67_27295 [Rhodocytophaga rosea]
MKTILIFIIINLFLISTLLGCGCEREKFSQEAYEKYELIFIGRLIEDEYYNIDGYQGLAFEVIEVLKGQTTKIVKGKNTAGYCSKTFSKDQEWIIYSIPEYGSINDQYACNLSTLLKDEFGESVIGKPDQLTAQKLKYELNYLRERKSEQDKIVSFQLLSLAPLFQVSFLIIALVSSIIMGERIRFYTPSILPASIVAATFGAIFLYFIFLPEQKGFKIPLMIVTLFSFLSLANTIYLRWYKGQLTYIKSFVLCYITYILMIMIAVPLLIYNKYPLDKTPSIDNPTLQDIVIPLSILLSIGLSFSIILSLFYNNLYKIGRSKNNM